jgi:hypothetical protein
VQYMLLMAAAHLPAPPTTETATITFADSRILRSEGAVAPVGHPLPHAEHYRLTAWSARQLIASRHDVWSCLRRVR